MGGPPKRLSILPKGSSPAAVDECSCGAGDSMGGFTPRSQGLTKGEGLGRVPSPHSSWVSSNRWAATCYFKEEMVFRVLLGSPGLKDFRAASRRPCGERHGGGSVQFQLCVLSLRATVVSVRMCHATLSQSALSAQGGLASPLAWSSFLSPLCPSGIQHQAWRIRNAQ